MVDHWFPLVGQTCTKRKCGVGAEAESVIHSTERPPLIRFSGTAGDGAGYAGISCNLMSWATKESLFLWPFPIHNNICFLNLKDIAANGPWSSDRYGRHVVSPYTVSNSRGYKGEGW